MLLPLPHRVDGPLEHGNLKNPLCLRRITVLSLLLVDKLSVITVNILLMDRSGPFFSHFKNEELRVPFFGGDWYSCFGFLISSLVSSFHSPSHMTPSHPLEANMVTKPLTTYFMKQWWDWNPGTCVNEVSLISLLVSDPLLEIRRKIAITNRFWFRAIFWFSWIDFYCSCKWLDHRHVHPAGTSVISALFDAFNNGGLWEHP